jgi:hypothetical protein
MGNANSSDDNGQQQQRHLPNPAANHNHHHHPPPPPHHHLAAAAAVRNFLKNAASGVANGSGGGGGGNNAIGVSKAELDERCRPSGYVVCTLQFLILQFVLFHPLMHTLFANGFSLSLAACALCGYHAR